MEGAVGWVIKTEHTLFIYEIGREERRGKENLGHKRRGCYLHVLRILFRQGIRPCPVSLAEEIFHVVVTALC